MANKVSTNDMERLPKIVAVDFDGTLVEGDYNHKPGEGWVNFDLFDKLKKRRAEGWKVVLWTCRTGQPLFEAVHFCSKQGLYFDAVNENVQEVKDMFGEDTRKVYADLYIDDKACIPAKGGILTCRGYVSY